MAGDINKITQEDVAEFKRQCYTPASYDGNALDAYQQIATKTAIYPGNGTPLGLDYAALKGAGEAGEFAEHVGKAMRDDKLIEILGPAEEPDTYVVRFNQPTNERRDALIKEIGDQLWYLSAKCNELGIKLSQAAVINLEKLCSRSERGKLSGSGDNR